MAAILTVAEVKEHLRIENDYENTLLSGYIEQAQAAAEDYCRVSFDPSTAPEAVKTALHLYIGWLYENRDSPDTTAYKAMHTAWQALLYPHRDESKMF